MRSDVLTIARECLKTPGEPRALKTHVFSGDEDAHDEKLQERLAAEFKSAFDECVTQFDVEFGSASVVNLEEGTGDDGAIETALSLVNGPIHVALWKPSKVLLFLAVAHEDRETPMELLVGTAED